MVRWHPFVGFFPLRSQCLWNLGKWRSSLSCDCDTIRHIIYDTALNWSDRIHESELKNKHKDADCSKSPLFVTPADDEVANRLPFFTVSQSKFDLCHDHEVKSPAIHHYCTVVFCAHSHVEQKSAKRCVMNSILSSVDLQVRSMHLQVNLCMSACAGMLSVWKCLWSFFIS